MCIKDVCWWQFIEKFAVNICGKLMRKTFLIVRIMYFALEIELHKEKDFLKDLMIEFHFWNLPLLFKVSQLFIYQGIHP